MFPLMLAAPKRDYRGFYDPYSGLLVHKGEHPKVYMWIRLRCVL